jgi:hypothetical protein
MVADLAAARETVATAVRIALYVRAAVIEREAARETETAAVRGKVVPPATTVKVPFPVKVKTVFEPDVADE